MPTYEYRCDAGHQYEKREGFDAPARQKCQICGREAGRVLFAPPVVFKGSGFYKTDNRGSSVAEPAAPATNGTSDHGHAHGPDGHSHDTPPLEPSTESAAAS